MPFCPQCGAPATTNEQCPRCGALCPGDKDGGLEIDEVALHTPLEAGVTGERASAAQLGATAGSAPALQAVQPAPRPTPRPAAMPSNPRSFAERESADRVLLWRLTRLPVLCILGWFTASHLFLGSTWVFVDNVNILVHEAGHVFFRWGGDTIHALGGTLLQLILPATFATYFAWWRRERFAGTVCVWWLGENLMPISLYMHDAPTEELPLIGGTVHDWNYLYGKWDLLHRAQDIAEVFRWIGILSMIATLFLLGWWTLRPNQHELAPSAA